MLTDKLWTPQPWIQWEFELTVDFDNSKVYGDTSILDGFVIQGPAR